MTNLDKLLENDAGRLANELMSVFRNTENIMIGYTGPHHILFSLYDKDLWWMINDRPLIKRAGIVKIIGGFENVESAKSACINAIKDWFREEIKWV